MKLILEKESGSRIEITTFPFTVGRSANCNFILDSKMASRKHAQFIQEGPDVFLEDLNSSNGTYVNLNPLSGRIKIYQKDQLKFADVRMKVLAGPERP
jgi:pSer/pThr/pTyr-binding forkhead associated (FHA) protein